MRCMSTRWLEFYRGAGPDSSGRLLSQILAWDDERLESVHDFIQWLFPLPEPSLFNPDAPILTEAEMVAARGDQVIQSNLKLAIQRMRRFYGLTPETEHLPKSWLRPADHNHLRLTRILRSLRLLGRPADAQHLFEDLGRYDAGIPSVPGSFGAMR